MAAASCGATDRAAKRRKGLVHPPAALGQVGLPAGPSHPHPPRRPPQALKQQNENPAPGSPGPLALAARGWQACRSAAAEMAVGSAESAPPPPGARTRAAGDKADVAEAAVAAHAPCHNITYDAWGSAVEPGRRQ